MRCLVLFMILYSAAAVGVGWIGPGRASPAAVPFSSVIKAEAKNNSVGAQQSHARRRFAHDDAKRDTAIRARF